MTRVKTLAWLIISAALLGCAEESFERSYKESMTASYLSHTKSDPVYLNNYLIKLERIVGEHIGFEYEEVIVEFGDGEVAVLTGNRELLPQNQYLWTYEIQHTYPASGEFDIAVYKGSCAQIAEEESTDEPFITNKLVIEPRLGRNSVVTANYVKVETSLGYVYSLGAQDVEGDSIAFEIINTNNKAALTLISRDSLLVDSRGLSVEFTVSINEFRSNRHLGFTQLKVAKETSIKEE